MSDEHHEWQLGSAAPFIRPHSLAKHRVIAKYLSRYVDVLTGDLRIPEFRLTLIDGFAGGGRYRDERTHEDRDGSPLLMLNAMRESEKQARARRSKDFVFDVDFFFIESSEPTIQYLKTTLEQSEFRHMLVDKVSLINGMFVSQVDHIIEHVTKRGRGNRAIFVLDQCGYSAVPLGSIQTILSKLSHAEIILTFATDSLIDYLSSQQSMQKTLQTVGLELGEDEIRSDKQSLEWRRVIQYKLHKQIPAKSEAKYYTPFFIRSKDAHRDYWLIHLSNHPRARDVMVGLHWDENTSFAHYGRSGLKMLGYDQDEDIKVTGQGVFPEFRFDEIARVSTHECLLDELPSRLVGFRDGVTFADFFAGLTNETPATREILKEALRDLHKDGVIEIRDKTGLTSRKAGIQHSSDIIRPARQRLWFMPGS